MDSQDSQPDKRQKHKTSTSFVRRRHKRSMSDAYMSTKEVIDKDEKAYSLFSNRPQKDILAILNLQAPPLDDDTRDQLSKNNSMSNDKLSGRGIFRNFSVEDEEKSFNQNKSNLARIEEQDNYPTRARKIQIQDDDLDNLQQEISQIHPTLQIGGSQPNLHLSGGVGSP